MNKIFKEEIHYLFTVIGGVALTLIAFNALDKDVAVLQTKTQAIEERLKRIETILETKYGVYYDSNTGQVQVKQPDNAGKVIHKRTI